MCGIAGFTNSNHNFSSEPGRWIPVLEAMNQAQKHRGPNDEGTLLSTHCGLAQVRLSIIDLVTGHQPMTKRQDENTCSITYNGEIYNMKELKKELQNEGLAFETSSDTEVILAGYMRYGVDYIRQLNGIFSIALWDEGLQTLTLIRDRLGVKPLFYTILEDTLIFSSEIKGLFQYPGFTPRINHDSLCEVFGLGPAKSYGKGVFQDVYEVLPGHMLTYRAGVRKEEPYWTLESHPHTDSYRETVEKTSYLLQDAVTKQMLSDIPICTFLSGGVDSSLVTAICAKELKKQGKTLTTFSFDFKDNAKHFKSNSFQPSEDRPWVDKMVEHLQTDHHYLECDNGDLIANLYNAVDARDLPCMADVESSLLFFCGKVAPHNKVTLTGECADEIFGGYPWFHKKEMFETHAFPWAMDLSPRKALLADDLLASLQMDEYVNAAYEKTLAETPILPGESSYEGRRRELAWLNLRWFMVTLLDRMDRTSMYSGLEARVPFADHRIVEYIWNVPWEMKCPDGLVKGLLRAAGEDYLPYEVLYRKKSPYPKTYNPRYEYQLGQELLKVLEDSNAPIRTLTDRGKVEEFLRNPSDYGKPWYGQLMAGPQMLAYLLQVNYWMKKYHLSF